MFIKSFLTVVRKYGLRCGYALLVFAEGAAAISRQEIGISIFGGIMFGKVLVLFFIPVMYLSAKINI
ncbi:TPA: efflux RND transporter permease subunit [Acinetobacter baumannii]|nr:efflux RND transporter permease subunit [Acinetobacter baumannii]